MVEKVLVDYEFTDETRKVLKAIHLNLDNLAEEAGYILKEKVIPIEWIKNEVKKAMEPNRYRDYDLIYAACMLQLLEHWEKENENS